MSATISTIPASTIVNVVPSVLNAGGSALELIGLMLTNSNRVPSGSVLRFPTSTSVSGYFGATSVEATNANIYFSGFLNSNKKPGAFLVANYPLANTGAFLRSASLANMTLSQLQAISGVLTVTIDGTPHTSSSINLSSATSFSQAAQLITNALTTVGPSQAVVTGSFGATFTGTASGTNLTTTSVVGVIHPGATITGTGISGTVTIISQTSGPTGGAGVYVTSASTTASSAAITATSNVLDVTAVTSGTIAAGQEVTGTSVTTGTYVNSLGTGTGGIGTYVTSNAQQIASETITLVTPTVTYDSIASAFTVVSPTTGASSTISFGTGTIAVPLSLTLATGAVNSQGAAAAVPATYMTNLTNQTQDFATFFTSFDPDAGSGNTQKLLFAAWNNSQNNRYAYIVDDTDVTPTLSTTATTSMGYILKQLASSGIIMNYVPAGNPLYLAAFVSGAIASLDFTEHNGRATLAFRGQSGLGTSVTNALVASNLEANDYNFTGIFATANQEFMWYYPGQVTGQFQWIDSYINQIWLNNALQLALMELLNNVKSIAYNPAGYGLVRQACLDPIAAAVNFGAIRQGVTLSNAQIAEVNSSAGLKIDGILSTQGWYLQILDAQPQVRQARQSPPMTLWYMDGESIQQITLASILIQ